MSNRFLNRTVHSPIAKDTLRSSQISSNSQKHPLFLTQNSNKYNHQVEILQMHSQLNNYIEDLEAKVQKVVQHNEAELLFAYKNHLERVRQEMIGFKQETIAVIQSESSHKDKIQIMQKELIIFRQEALKLFEKSIKKDKIIEDLQIRLDEYKSQLQHMNQTVKALLKQNKELEAALKMQKLYSKNETIGANDYLGKIQVNSFVGLGISSHKKLLNREKKMKDRVMASSLNTSKMFAKSHQRTRSPTQYYKQFEEAKTNDLDNFSKCMKIKLSYIEPKLLQNIIESACQAYSSIVSKKWHNNYSRQDYLVRQSGSSLKSNSYKTCESNFKPRKSTYSNSSNSKYSNFWHENNSDSQLRDYFKKCVEIIKKEIAYRRKIKTINFFKEGSPITLDDFKKVDFMKLAELVFSNERLIEVIYSNLFT